MELYKRQQFEFLLQTAVERFAERLEHRCHTQAEVSQAAAGDLEQFGFDEFIDALFADFLLESVEGACFVLQAVAKQPVDELPRERPASVESTLVLLAKSQFRSLLRRKIQEAIDYRTSFQPVRFDAGEG